MQLIPGGSLIFSFDVESATGTPVNFDAAPTVTFYHNGVADTAWTSYTLTNVVAGHYVMTTTIPSGYALADEISVYVSGTISSVAVGLTAFEGQLAHTPDNANVETWAGSGVMSDSLGNPSVSVLAWGDFQTATAVYLSLDSQNNPVVGVGSIGGQLVETDGSGRVQSVAPFYAVSGTITTSQTTLTIAGKVSSTTHMGIQNATGATEIVQVTANSYTSPNTTLTVVRGLFATAALSGSGLQLTQERGLSAFLAMTGTDGKALLSANAQTNVVIPTVTTVTGLAAGALTSIAGAVWNALLTGYNVASSFGNWLQSLANGSGSGAWQVIVPVTDNATPANPLQNITVSLTLNSSVFSAVTDSNGNATFNLNTGTYAEAAAHPLYSVVTSGPVNVSANMTAATIVMAPVAIPAAPSGSITGYSYTYRGASIAPYQTVKYYLSGVGTGSGQILNGDVLAATSDSTGLLTIVFPYGTQWTIMGSPNVVVNVPSTGSSFELPSVRVV